MILLNLAITGGILYAGGKAYQRRKGSQKKAWLVKSTSVVEEPAPTSTAPSRGFGHYFAISTLSLGLSTSGVLIYAPLGVASIPFNLYTTIPVLSEAIYQLLEERRLKAGLITSVAVLVTLVKQEYLIASSLDWGYYAIITLKRQVTLISRNFVTAFEESYRQILYEFLNTSPQFVWIMVDGVELKIPYETLEVGDILVVDSIGVVPVQGVVTEGEATVDRYVATGTKDASTVQVGDVVYPTTIVLSGRIYIQVSYR